MKKYKNQINQLKPISNNGCQNSSPCVVMTCKHWTVARFIGKSGWLIKSTYNQTFNFQWIQTNSNSPTRIRHVGTSGLFKWIKYSITLVCKLLAAKCITVWPDVSLCATLAPNETKHSTASNAPDVDDSSNGVDLRLELKKWNWKCFGLCEG